MSLPAAEPGNRLERMGQSSVSRKPEGGPKELTPRYRLLVEYQIDGSPHADLLQRVKRPKAVIDDATGLPVIREVPVEPGVPLTLIEAADVLRIRRRNARQLTKTRAYQDHMAAELQSFRDGERARSFHTMVEIRDDPGFGKAADRKVRLNASQMLLGEGDGNRAGPTVNIYNGGQKITAGVVIRLPPTAQRAPLEHTHSIEHEDRDDG